MLTSANSCDIFVAKSKNARNSLNFQKFRPKRICLHSASQMPHFETNFSPGGTLLTESLAKSLGNLCAALFWSKIALEKKMDPSSRKTVTRHHFKLPLDVQSAHGYHVASECRQRRFAAQRRLYQATPLPLSSLRTKDTIACDVHPCVD